MDWFEILAWARQRSSPEMLQEIAQVDMPDELREAMFGRMGEHFFSHPAIGAAYASGAVDFIWKAIEEACVPNGVRPVDVEEVFCNLSLDGSGLKMGHLAALYLASAGAVESLQAQQAGEEDIVEELFGGLQ